MSTVESNGFARNDASVLAERLQVDQAQARARAFREVRTRFAACDAALLAEAKQRFGVEAPLGNPTASGMMTLHCPPQHVQVQLVEPAGVVVAAHVDEVFV